MRGARRVHGKTLPSGLDSRPTDADQAPERSFRRDTAEHPDAGPSGTLILIGKFMAQHKDEILSLVRDVEAKHAAENLGRVIDMNERQDGSIRIRFTTPLLARRAGEAIYGRYWGELELQQTDDGQSLSMTWWR